VFRAPSRGLSVGDPDTIVQYEIARLAGNLDIIREEWDRRLIRTHRRGKAREGSARIHGLEQDARGGSGKLEGLALRSTITC
jgi:hypothetical protein